MKSVFFGLVCQLVRRSSKRVQQGGIIQDLGDQFFRAGFAIHVGQQIGQLRACFQQLIQRAYFLGDAGRRKVFHAFKRDVDAQIAFASQGIGHLEGHWFGDTRHIRIDAIAAV